MGITKGLYERYDGEAEDILTRMNAIKLTRDGLLMKTGVFDFFEQIVEVAPEDVKKRLKNKDLCECTKIKFENALEYDKEE